jgi:outer membrane protein assembly factor BamB
MVHERIFPEFLVWDDHLVQNALSQVVGRLSPGVTVDFKSTPLTFDRLAATPLVVPRLRELPSLLWQADVGRQAWKNSPLVVGNSVLVGSAGDKWNEPDQRDGIYSLDVRTGAIDWYARTPADANRLLLSKGVVTTGCDDGSVVAVAARGGGQIWRIQLDRGIVGGPIKLSANIGSPPATAPDESAGDADPVLLVSYSGHVYLLDLWTGRLLQDLDVGHQIIGEPLLYKWKNSDMLAVPTISGTLVFLEYLNFLIHLRAVQHTALQYPSQYAESGHRSPLLASQPVWADGLILQGIVRDTCYPEAPIIALDAGTKEFRWIGTDPDQKVGLFGNLRAAPLVLGGEVIFTSAYSGGLYSLSASDGELSWAVELGQGMFQQWCGAIAGNESVYVGRHDGYLHKVDIRQRRRDWSMFLGNSKVAGAVVSGEQKLPELGAAYSWNIGASRPILATPALDSGRLYVGTEEGYLYCIGNLGED